MEGNELERDMTGKVLIVYTSRKGSTEEIARAIAAELEAMGNTVTVADMEGITSVGDFSAVIIGAPVYLARIEKAVPAFVARNSDGLPKVPVAAFVVGIAPVNPAVGSVEEVLGKLRAALDPVKPAAVTMFAGVLDLSRMSFVERTMTTLMNVFTGDFRDWEAIRAWARELPPVLNLSQGVPVRKDPGPGWGG
jgi:menaquinone-dependent protoporphyrinogen oxidase